MSIADAFLRAGLIPEAPKPAPEKKKRREEEAGAFRRLEMDKRMRSGKKRDRKEAAEAAQKKNGLDELMANQKERLARNKISDAAIELTAARKLCRPSNTLTPDE